MFQPDNSIHTLVIHCAATPNGKAFHARDIDLWHKTRGFQRDTKAVNSELYPLRHIGYHHVITLDGTVENGRRHQEVGAHVRGHNKGSIGICLIGTDRYTLRQWRALATLITRLCQELPIHQVVGHRDLSPDTNRDGKVSENEWLKTCPGFDVKPWFGAGMKPLEGHLLFDGTTEKTLPHVHTPLGEAGPATVASVAGGAIEPGFKPWWQSKTIIGIVIAGLPALAHAAGIDYDQVLAPYAADITNLVGAVLAIIGRATASKSLSKA